jgi:hypothetical protein
VEFIAVGLVALILGLRGLRAERKTYWLAAGATIAAALYVFHSP